MSSIFVKIRYYWFFSIIRKVFNFQCHNLSFRDGYIPPESPTKPYGIQGRNDNMHEPVIGQIPPFFCLSLKLIPFIIANLQHKSMRTSRIDRCEPRYAGTEFTNRVCVYFKVWRGSILPMSLFPSVALQYYAIALVLVKQAQVIFISIYATPTKSLK